MAAKSYKCEDCGAFLRTIKEAQDHGDVTGHANFAESEEAVLTLVCVTCGCVLNGDPNLRTYNACTLLVFQQAFPYNPSVTFKATQILSVLVQYTLF